jgi:hypothetical protein
LRGFYAKSLKLPMTSMPARILPEMSREVGDVPAECAELRRLLAKHQWSGLVPAKSNGACPECAGSKPPQGRGHRPGCAIAAVLGES